jgi:[ribosomal protein S5]-alanine N-acetyltransferase
MLQPTELHTERLWLRAVTVDDADAYFAMGSHPKYAPFGSSAFQSLESTRRAIRRNIKALWRTRVEFVIVFEKRVVGRIVLSKIDLVAGTANLAYGVHPDVSGKGITTEAAKAVVAYALRDIGLQKISATTNTENAASMRVLEKIGMQRERVVSNVTLENGKVGNRAYFRLLRTE